MKNQLINIGFIEWLNQLEIAPYSVMFWDLPKIVQHAYIQKFLRDKFYTHVIIERDDDYWIVKTLEFKSGNKYNKICFDFNDYDKAFEYGLKHVASKTH